MTGKLPFSPQAEDRTSIMHEWKTFVIENTGKTTMKRIVEVNIYDTRS